MKVQLTPGEILAGKWIADASETWTEQALTSGAVTALTLVTGGIYAVESLDGDSYVLECASAAAAAAATPSTGVLVRNVGRSVIVGALGTKGSGNQHWACGATSGSVTSTLRYRLIGMRI